MNRILLAAAAVLLVVALSGCSGGMTVTDLTKGLSEGKYLGEKLTVQGTAKNSIRLGELSGFTLTDGTNSIPVASQTLPPENSTVVVKGTVMKELLIGYYIYADKVDQK